MKNKKIISISSSISFLFLVFFVYKLHHVSLSNTYEPSFYTNIPYSYFIFLIISFSLFVFNCMNIEKYSKMYKITYWLLYLLLLFVLSSLWTIKYGRFYGIGDPYIHLIYIKNIISSGHVQIAQNFYPSLHIFVPMLTNTTNISFETLYTYLYPVIVCLFGMYILLLGKSVLSDNFTFLLVFTIVNPVILDTSGTLVPFQFASLSLPLMFYIYMKAEKKGYDPQLLTLLLIYGLFLVISHVQVAITYIIAVLFMHLAFLSLKKLRISEFKNDNRFILYLIYLGIILTSWIAYLYYLNKMAVSALSMIVDFLSGNVSIESIEQTKITFRSPVNFILKRIIVLSETFLVIVIIAFIMYKTIKYLRSNNRNIIPRNVYLCALSTYIVINGFLYVFMMKSISREFGIYGRFIYLASLVYPIYLTFGITEFLFLIKKPKSKQIAFLLIILFTVGLFTTGVLVKYPDPSLGYYSKYTTNNIITGIGWGHSNINLKSSKIMGGGDHFESLIIYLYGKANPYFRAMYGSTNGLLKFLGYNPKDYEHRGIHEKYIATGKIEYIYYEPLMKYFLANPKYAPSIVTVNKSELNKKENLIMIYDNQGMTIYKVQ